MITRRRAVIGLCFLSCVAVAAAVVISIRRPSGEWDAWAIWNPKAKAILEGGNIWATEHPDYPLLLPSLIAMLWWVTGSQTPVVPAVVSISFAAATVVVLIRAVQHYCSETAGIISGCVLLTSPFFITQAAAQYADIPSSLFILASLARLDSPIVAGFLAGLAASVKNEGLLFLVALSLSLAFVTRKCPWRFLLGSGAPVIAVLYFKIFLSPPNDILSSLSTASLLEKLATPMRYGEVLGVWGIELANVLLWGAGSLPILIIYYLAVRGDVSKSSKPIIRTVSITLVLMVFGFFAIYLITPRDLQWHLGTSADRLILQLLPSSLFLFFLLRCGGREESDECTSPDED